MTERHDASKTGARRRGRAGWCRPEGRRASCVSAVVLLVAALAASPAAAQEEDPWEGFNRSIFAFNEWLDLRVLIPVAKGWDFVVPEVAQTGLENAYQNLNMVIVMGNDILQLKPMPVAEDLGRIVVNTTVGIGGLFDVATKIGIPENDEDFGQTLGYWGIPAGPFLMLPLFGPSNVRDTVGLAVDSASQPVSYFIPYYATIPGNAVIILNRRAIFLEEIDDLRETSLDYYSFQRNAFVQYRIHAIEDRDVPDAEEEEDLYYFDEEE